MKDTITQDELSKHVKKDVQQRGALYAKHLSWMTLVHEMQGRAPTGKMQYYFDREERGNYIGRRFCISEEGLK